VILVDINVLMDAAEHREPHYLDAAVLMERVIRRELIAMVPAHGVTTLHYLLSHGRGSDFATRQVGWLLRHFEVGGLDREGFRQAHAMGWPDFEDAVVAVTAERHGCEVIVTRDLAGFASSSVPAIPPAELGIDSIHEEIVAAYA
jgi:predicted nucleic acid-binding protein